MVAKSPQPVVADRPCADRLDDIHRFIDDEMHARERVAMEQHLRSCAGCDAYTQKGNAAQPSALAWLTAHKPQYRLSTALNTSTSASREATADLLGVLPSRASK